MLKKLPVIVAFSFFAFSPHHAHAQDCQIDSLAVLPLAFSGQLPVISAAINGQTVQIGVDTGNETTAVTSETATRLNLPTDARHLTTVQGAGGTIQTHNVLLDSLDIAGNHFTHLSVPVIAIPDHPGVAALFGANILSNYDLEFNFPQKTLTFYRVQNCESIFPSWQQPYQQINITVTRSKLILMQVELDGHLLTGLFDTGAYSERLNMAAIVNAGLVPDFLAPDPLKKNTGVAGTFEGHFHQFSWLKIGDEKFTDPQIGVFNEPTAFEDILIGEDYMSGRRFWLSYSTNTLFVQTP